MRDTQTAFQTQQREEETSKCHVIEKKVTDARVMRQFVFLGRSGGSTIPLYDSEKEKFHTVSPSIVNIRLTRKNNSWQIKPHTEITVAKKNHM